MHKQDPAREWQTISRRLQQELRARQAYRRAGKPCPMPLAQRALKLRTLARLEQELQQQVLTELQEEAHRLLEETYNQHVASLARGTKNVRQRRQSDA